MFQEQPCSEETIQENLSKGNHLNTTCTIVGVPISHIEEVVIPIELSKSKINICEMSTEDKLCLLRDLIDSLTVVTVKGMYGSAEQIIGADFEIDTEQEDSIVVATMLCTG